VATAQTGKVSVESVALIDDTDAAVRDQVPAYAGKHREAWREWLRLSNLMGWGGSSAQILAYTAADAPAIVEATPDGASETRSAEVAQVLEDAWQEALDLTDSPLEAKLVRELAAIGSIPVPTIGEESSGTGVVVPLGWPQLKLASSVSISVESRNLLEYDGWNIVDGGAKELAPLLTGER
jgi:hypothetical protein